MDDGRHCHRGALLYGAVTVLLLVANRASGAEVPIAPRVPTLEMSELYMQPEALPRHQVSEILFYISIGLDFATTAYGILELDLEEIGPLHGSFGNDALLSAVIVDGFLIWLRHYLGRRHWDWKWWAIDGPFVAFRLRAALSNARLIADVARER